MTEASRVIATIRAQLKSQGRTYRDVAKALHLSEPSVKRLFATGRFTLDRLVRLSNLLGLTLAELAQESVDSESRLRSLTETQERELVSDTKLLLVAACALNHWTLADIVAAYRLTEAECLKRLLRLDRLRLIDLLPGNRIRLNVSRNFAWLPHGPIRKYFRDQGLTEFLDSSFAQADETQEFAHGMLTEAAVAQIQTELKRLREKFSELHDQSLSAPLRKRHGTGLLLALREWEPVAFTQLRRQNAKK